MRYVIFAGNGTGTGSTVGLETVAPHGGMPGMTGGSEIMIALEKVTVSGTGQVEATCADPETGIRNRLGR